MTLREKLFRTAANTLGEEINEEMLTHYRVVSQYLESLCTAEASKGNFVVNNIELVKLSDGSTLSERDIEEFAKQNNLTYYPQNGLGFENI